ncbi:MAG: hypothetical protein L0Y64_11980 [Myxococcaceae bacterium]|nr:hypothetical protein [Myxococcaceae bacterium]
MLLLSSAAHAEVLYFALEVRQGGRLVAQPRLLGESGKPLRAVRRQPGASVEDYRLTLLPSVVGGGYSLALDLALGGVKGRSDVPILHGQERHLQLGCGPGDLEVSVLLMRVDSPEFRALMQLSAGSEPNPSI